MVLALITNSLLCNGVFIVPRPFFCGKAGDRTIGARAIRRALAGRAIIVQLAPCTDGRHRLQKKVGARCDENRGLTDQAACAILGATK